MKYFFTILFLFLFLSGISREPVYNFRVKDTIPHTLMTERVYATLATTLEGGVAYHGFVTTIETELPSSANTWYIGIDRKYAFENTDDVCVKWNFSGMTERSCLDIEDQDIHGNEPYSFTTPVLVPATRNVQLQIFSKVPFDRSDIHIFSLSTQPESYSYTWKIPIMGAENPIITRSEWGADETLRYADSDVWKSKYASYLQYVQNPKTQDQLDSILLGQKRESFLAEKNPLTNQYISVIRYENGHKLVWPIQKTKAVNRIIIHHTAESLDKNLADEDFLRAIYAYHTISRQWGDIGYNYIIGQRGKIYEGRAGGDYVVGAHAAYNNAGTVGISVIGDFETMHLNRDQKAGLEQAIAFFSKKYGIDLSEKKDGVRICKTSDCTLFESRSTQSLLGHRDVGYTTCPGQNIYDELSGFITKYASAYSLVLNTEKGHIDPLPKEEIMNMSLIPSVSTTSVGSSGVSSSSASVVIRPSSTPGLLRPTRSLGGPGVKIRLSYSGETIDIQRATAHTLLIKNGLKKIPIKTTSNISVGKVGSHDLVLSVDGKYYTGNAFSFSSDVVRIASWSRVPAWDTSGKYNDNLFRGKIIMRNDSGKLLVINELPLEDYLRGMGEVSNTDPVEKIKTIVVAARSYARFYTSKINRKFHTSLYDGSDNPDEFQKYLGYGYEMRSPNVSSQVQATKGEVITYKGNLIKPWYFNESDGKTRSYREYCESNGGKTCEDIPYLQSVDDPASIGHTRKGHGVGISGIGATYAANLGKTYKEIIAYYLTGVAIEKK